MIGYIHTKSGIDTSDATAQSNNILDGKTAYVNEQKLTGTMANNGTLNYNASINQQFIPEGYTSGGTINATTSAIDSNIKSENIKSGVSILGVTGNFTNDANAIASDILENKTAYVDGQKLNGTMLNRGNLVITPTTSQQTFQNGYYSGISCGAKEEVHAISLKFTQVGYGTNQQIIYNLVPNQFPYVPMHITTIMDIIDWRIVETNGGSGQYSWDSSINYIVFRYSNNGWDIGIKRYDKTNDNETVQWLAINVQKGQQYTIQSVSSTYAYTIVNATFTVEDIYNN